MSDAFTAAYALGTLEGAMWLPPISHWEIAAEENGDWSIHGELKADTPGEARRLLRPLADTHNTETATEGHLLTVTFQRDAVNVRVWWLLPVHCWTDRVPMIAAAGTETWLAEYEGADPAAFTSEPAARGYCDDFARAEARGRAWDWMPHEDGYLQQIWTHDLNDAPTGATGGIVTRLTIQDTPTVAVTTGALADGDPP